jgi:hypothetical protein
LKLYLNNQLKQTTASTVTPTSGNKGIILMKNWGGAEQASYKTFWGGNLAVVRIYSRALSSTEIQSCYDADKTKFGL